MPYITKYLFLFIFIANYCFAKSVNFPILTPKQLGPHSTQIESAYQSILSQDFPSAKQKLNRLLNSDQRPSAIYYLSHVYLKLDQMDRAQDQLSRLKSYPSFHDALLHGEAVYDSSLAWYFLRRKRWTKAHKLFKKSISSLHSDDLLNFISEIYLDRTKFWKRGKDLKNKIQLLSSSLEINPKHEVTLESLSQLLIHQNEHLKAESFLESLVERYPTKQRRLSLADLYTYTNKVRIAAKIYRTLHNQYPQDFIIKNKYQQTNQFLQLNHDTNWQSEQLENDNQLRNELQSLEELLIEKNYLEAEALIESLIEKNPEEWKLHKEIISLYRLQKKYSEALNKLNYLSDKFGFLNDFNYQKILTLEKVDSKKAIALINDLLQNPDLSNEQRYPYQEVLAKLYLKIGKLEAARKILEQLIEISYPTRHIANFYYGVYYSQIRYFQKSLEYYHLAYDEQGNNPKYLLALTTTLRQLGHQEKAKIYYLKLINSFAGSQYTEYAKKLFPNIDLSKINHTSNNAPPYFDLFYSIHLKKSNLSLTKTLELLKETHQWDLLLEYLEYALKRNPSQPEFKLTLEKLYKNYKDLDFTYNIITQDYINEIEKLHRNGQVDILNKFYRSLHPHVYISPEIRNLMAKYLLESDFFQSTELIYTSLLNDGPHKIQYYSQLGYLYFTSKQFERSLNAYYQALNLNPANSTILFKLAELLRTTGELQKSQLIYQEIINMNLSTQSVEDAQFYLRQLNLEINTSN
ncbi:MAG: hypothetical protein COB02_04875 [Candidatus Cloacimonadota bacterium]|nr:MAG: hypothetical protein COB02_04875 [Candidatus Cloacimonadota bacterium]